MARTKIAVKLASIEPQAEWREAPDWLREFCRRENERTAPIPKGAAGKDYQQGALIGHSLRAMFALLEAPPDHCQARTFNETRDWLREQVGTAVMLPNRDRAAQYLRGILYGLLFTTPERGAADTDELRRIFFEHLEEIKACRTQQAVANTLKRYLPQDKVKRWNADQAAVFNNCVRTFCRQIGFRPAMRGRPSK